MMKKSRIVASEQVSVEGNEDDDVDDDGSTQGEDGKVGERRERKEGKKSFPGVCVNLQSLQVPAVTLVPLGHFSCDPTK